MPPLIDPRNVYSESARNRLARSVARDLHRIYVPNLGGGVSVIDPATYRVIYTLAAGRSPQHVVPAWDLRTLWVTNTAEGRPDGTVTAIDPRTGKPVGSFLVDDPYNMYFTPDGKSAIVVAERYARLDFRDPHTMVLQGMLHVPGCVGINHADYSADGRYALFTCEFNGRLAKVDTIHRKVLGYLKLSRGMMPQDLRAGPNGRTFFVADMRADGVFVVDGDRFKEIAFIPTGVGAHGLYPSRDARRLYVANRGSHMIRGMRHGKFGNVTVIDFATRKIVARWQIPGGGSPDMGNVSADGRTLWLSGRYDNVVYAIDTTSGKVRKIPVGVQPHGLAVWPQPGRYSLGHTGIMR
ncbi:MAG TPA: YncE family protein [Candidatus Elarobacter sp.]|jgi:YVTN family beta-propeller protein|nr:YncE family protein [Candidatus Elarobacter sp.]